MVGAKESRHPPRHAASMMTQLCDRSELGKPGEAHQGSGRMRPTSPRGEEKVTNLERWWRARQRACSADGVFVLGATESTAAAAAHNATQVVDRVRNRPGEVAWVSVVAVVVVVVSQWPAFDAR